MPPSASWAPMSLVRSLLKPTITKPTRATRTTITMMAMSILLSLFCGCCARSMASGTAPTRSVWTLTAGTGHHDPPPPPPPPPPPEKPPPPPPLDDELWVALYDEIAQSTVLLKSPTIEFTNAPVLAPA